MTLTNILVSLLVAIVVYFLAAIFVPAPWPMGIALIVFLLGILGGPRYWRSA